MSGNNTLLKNFRRVRVDVDTAPFLAEIEKNSSDWVRRTERQNRKTEQRETQTIFLRAPTLSLIPGAIRNLMGIVLQDAHGSFWTPESRKLPVTCGFLRRFADEHKAKLARATLVRLKPGGKVYEHIDEGEYYKKRNRYHLVLQSPNGSVLNSGGENVTMRNGELWWFDNKKMHSALNYGDDWRIHIIFDMLPG
jgi:Aspartyl/Asparaginyl beta-hydroxylase